MQQINIKQEIPTPSHQKCVKPYKAVSKYVTERVLLKNKTPSTGLIMRDHDILVQKKRNNPNFPAV